MPAPGEPPATPVLSEDQGGLVILVRVPRRASSILGWGFALAGWVTIFAKVLRMVLAQFPPAAPETLLVLLVGLAGGAAILLTLASRLAGRERIRLCKHSLEIRREVFSLGLPRRFELERIRALRFYPHEAAAGAFGLDSGGLSFEYGRRVHWFGAGIRREDAQRLISAIQRRFRRPELSQPGELDATAAEVRPSDSGSSSAQAEPAEAARNR
ncbi:MAG: hypothetical protein HYZ28_27695 [Myxococcales bacterium]|nr:hypothetical protein [Myxococcales bacterium]